MLIEEQDNSIPDGFRSLPGACRDHEGNNSIVDGDYSEDEEDSFMEC